MKTSDRQLYQPKMNPNKKKVYFKRTHLSDGLLTRREAEGEKLRSLMDPSVVESLQALERTAAWVNQVAQMRQMCNLQDLREDSTGDSNPDRDACSDKDFDDIPDSYEGLQSTFDRDPFESSDSSRQADAGSSSTMDFVDIPATVQEFKAALESSGISQRFAAKFIMDSTSQGNLSFLLEKGKSKHWSELSGRGRLPYIRMRRWLDSPEEQRITLSQLSMSKEFKKTGPKDSCGRRGKFTLFQLMVLCRFFEEDQNPSLNTRMLLAEKLIVSLERITIWFQNQRARGFPAKRVLCLMSVDRQNAESEKAEFGRKYQNIQNDIQKRTQALTGALQSMTGHKLHIPNPVNRIEDGFNTNMACGKTTESQDVSGVLSNKDLSPVPGAVRYLPASLPQNQRYKPYDVPSMWGGSEKYNNFTNYFQPQTSTSSNGKIQKADTLQQDQSPANIKREPGEIGNGLSSGTCMLEKGKAVPDPRPTFLVQNLANSPSVFNRPYPQSTYPEDKIGLNGSSQIERMAMPKISSPQDKGMYATAVQKMAESAETAMDYDRYRIETSTSFLNYRGNSDGQESLKTLVKTEPNLELEDDSFVMSIQYRKEEGASLLPAENNVVPQEMNLASVKTENIDNGSAMDTSRASIRPVI